MRGTRSFLVPPPSAPLVDSTGIQLSALLTWTCFGRYIYNTRQQARDACLAYGCTGLADISMVTSPLFDWPSLTLACSQPLVPLSN